MGGGDRARVEMASFKVAGFSDILDWRPLLFQEPVIAQRACALCGVLYKKAIRLPCVHTLCTKCHAQCANEGGSCPVDQKPFCDDDIEHLEVSLKYIQNREVACWNAARGCGFTGPAASLLDHYKECEFSIVPCCLCGSSVLGSNIVEHFRSGCSIHHATSRPTDNAATKDFKDISSACLEMKQAMGKISEDLMSLQTSLNRCSEDVRAEGARCQGQWEAQASKLTEQLNTFGTAYSTGFAEDLEVLRAAVGNYEEHVCKELGLQREKLTMVSDAVKSLRSHDRPETVHWHVKGWAVLKKNALDGLFQTLYSPVWTIHGYNVSQLVTLKREDNNEVRVGCFIDLHPGEHDAQQEWPFRKVYTVGVIHPNDESIVISFKVNASWYGNQPCFQAPRKRSGRGFGRPRLSTAEKLEEDGFVVGNDALHVFLEIKP